MSRITATFDRLRAQGRQALVPFITAGYPFAAITPSLMHGMVEAGVDIIELGVPFSDPMADGPVIQKAGERAIANGVNLAKVIGYVREFRKKDKHTPVVLMGYANPIERYDQLHGSDAFVRDAAEAGLDGLLVVDYPPEECEEFAAKLKAQGIDLIFLLAPTSSDARIQEIARIASGYVYYVSLKGVTGSAALDTDDVARMLQRIKQHVQIPVGVGFGIRDAQTAHTVAQMADAVIIGSRIIQLLEDQPHEKVIPLAIDFLRNVRKAMDA
ncbi:MAG: tryptophan synthase subunit alpha [Comamonas sp.]|nr:tryptophan synthase subunit alpha [Comamonas sp.]